MIQHNLYHHEMYGMTADAYRDWRSEDHFAYLQALLAVAGADGDISPAEWTFFELLARTSGIPAEAIEQLRQFDFRGADVAKIIAGMRPNRPAASVRSLLYNAVKMSRADGRYAPEEQAAVRAVADTLGVDRAVVVAIEGLVEIELSLRAARLALFYDRAVQQG